MRRRGAGLLLVLAAGCAGATPPPERPAPESPALARLARDNGNAPAVIDHGAPPPADALAEWTECRQDALGRSLWLAVPRGAHVQQTGSACIAMPAPAASTEHADWFVVIGVVAESDDGAGSLASEPDGARRFAITELSIERASALGESEGELAGLAARTYALRGTASRLGTRELVTARVPVEGGWLVAVAATRPGHRAQLAELARLVALSRPR